MDDLTLWGNAAAVPIVIALTQLCKRSLGLNITRRGDVYSFCISLIVCSGWWIYNTPEEEILAVLQSGPIGMIKAFIDLLIVSFATWLSASKSYDLLIAPRKRSEVSTEKPNTSPSPQEGTDRGDESESIPPEILELDEKLHKILETGKQHRK